MSHATKMEAIRLLSTLPTGIEEPCRLPQPYLGHTPEHLALPAHVSEDLSHFLEERRCLANTFL